MHTPVSLGKANLLNFLDRLMAAYIELFDLGVLYREVVAVRLSSLNVFLPVLVFYRKERHTVLCDSYAERRKRTAERATRAREEAVHLTRRFRQRDPELRRVVLFASIACGGG